MGRRGSGAARPPAEYDTATLVLATALTMVTGATDALGLNLLGGVFTSVMTGNLVLLGQSVGRGDLELAASAATALAGYAVGVLGGSKVTGAPGPGRPRRPFRVTLALGAELLLLCGFLVLWAPTAGRPDGVARLTLLIVAALAMGVQSGLVHGIGIAGLSTTYLTGTLTVVLADLATARRLRRRSLVLLAALVTGAAGGGLLVAHAPAAAPALPVGLLALTVLAAAVILPRIRPPA
jgi:uncharacterized membrane protein YoaK (UPF0700 family)